MSLVIDASAALAWLAPSQATPAALALRSALPENLAAPSVFPAEVRNALIKLERRGLVDPDVARRGLVLLDAVIVTSSPPEMRELASIYALAQAEQISFFDACYLALAISARAPLATRDAGLIGACIRRGAQLCDLR